MEEDKAILTFHSIPSLNSSLLSSSPSQSGTVQFRHRVWSSSARGNVCLGKFVCISMVEKCEQREFAPTVAPLDRIKLLMQTHGIRIGHQSAKKAIGFIEAITLIGKEEGVKVQSSFWLTSYKVAMSMIHDEGITSFYYSLGPSLVRIAPYIAVNFCIFDLVKKSLPEKYRQKAQSSLVTAVLSAGIATSSFRPR